MKMCVVLGIGIIQKCFPQFLLHLVQQNNLFLVLFWTLLHLLPTPGNCDICQRWRSDGGRGGSEDWRRRRRNHIFILTSQLPIRPTGEKLMKEQDDNLLLGSVLSGPGRQWRLSRPPHTHDSLLEKCLNLTTLVLFFVFFYSYTETRRV